MILSFLCLICLTNQQSKFLPLLPGLLIANIAENVNGIIYFFVNVYYIPALLCLLFTIPAILIPLRNIHLPRRTAAAVKRRAEQSKKYIFQMFIIAPVLAA